MNHTRTALLACALSVIGTGAHAQTGFYVGVGAGASDYDVRSSDLATTVLAPAAVADLPGYFVANPPLAAPVQPWQTGANGGWSPCLTCAPTAFTEVAPSSTSIDTSGTALRIEAGYRFNRFFAAELAYMDLGSATYEATYVLPGTPMPFRQETEVEIDGAGLSLLAGYPFMERWNVFARGGYFFGDARVSRSMLRSPRYSADSAFFASGLDFTFLPGWTARLQYQRHLDAAGQASRGDIDVDSWSLGLQYGL